VSGLGAVLALGALLGSATPCELRLSGRVVDAAQGSPIPRAHVRGPGDRQVETDATGLYTLEGLCPGPNAVEASRVDYQPQVHTVNIPTDAALDFALEPRAVTRMDDVVVEAPRLDPRDTRALTRLEGHALERTRGEHLADALAEVPGVSVLRSGSTAKPILRGMSGPRVLVLFDGVRHESQDWGLDHGVEIDPFSAGSMSVVKGAAGVRYGPDAIAGVILVDPPPMLDAAGVKADLQLVGALNGRRGTVAGRVDARPAALERLALRLQGNVSKGRAVEAPDYPLDNTGVFEWNGGGRAVWTGEDLQLTLAYDHLATKNGVCTCLRNESAEDLRAQVLREAPVGVELYSASYEIRRAYQDVTHDRAMLRGEYDLGAGGALSATYAFQINLRREYEPVRSAVMGPQFDFTLRTHSVDATWAQPRVALGETAVLEGSVGLALQHQENIYRGLPLIPNYRQLGVGVFVTERLSLGSVDVEAGARYDLLTRTSVLDRDAYRRHLARGTLDADACDGVDPARCPRTFHVGAVSLGLIKDLGEDWTWKVDLSSAGRAPTIDEAYINGTAPSFPVLAIGAPSLGVETTWSLSTTLQGSLPWLAAEASAYVSYIDDYIYLAPELNPDGSPVVDVIIRGAFPRFTERAVDAVLFGGEGQAKLTWGPLELDLSVSLVRGQNLSRGEPLIRMPSDRGRAALTYHLPTFWGLEAPYLTVSGALVSRQTRYDPAEDFAVPPAGYALLGAGLGAEWRSGDVRIGASLDADNLLQQRYRDYTSLLRYYADEPGRQVLLRLSFSHGA
jgi:iron complex outermembrane receptor protein